MRVRLFVLVLFLGTVSVVVTYVSVQQTLRLSANEPQIQIAQDLAAAIKDGSNPQDLVSAYSVDVKNSLSLFVIVFDDKGSPVVSSAQLDGNTPTPPQGVFDYTRDKGEDRITWQPQPGVRLAAVVTRYSSDSGSGFVVAARSLKEVERTINLVGELCLAGWAALVLISLAVTFIFFPSKE